MTTQALDLTEVLLEKLQALSPEQQQQLLTFAEFLIYQKTQPTVVEGQTSGQELRQSSNVLGLEEPRSPQKQRVFGQYRGQIWMSDDFDAPLPDEFWLGES